MKGIVQVVFKELYSTFTPRGRGTTVRADLLHGNTVESPLPN
jgi:hypothetical protein